MITLGTMTGVTYLKALEVSEISFAYIALPMILGLMTICVAYLILKKGRIRITTGILLLPCFGCLPFIVLNMTIMSMIGTLAIYVFNGYQSPCIGTKFAKNLDE